MIEKYTISFSVEADLKDKEELAAMIWTLLKIGKQSFGEAPMTVPSLKEINVEVGCCDEPYQPFRLFLLPSNNSAVKQDTVPACCATRFRELYDTISDYITQGRIIAVAYVPKGTKQSEGRYVYSYSAQSGVYKDYAFFEKYPELD